MHRVSGGKLGAAVLLAAALWVTGSCADRPASPAAPGNAAAASDIQDVPAALIRDGLEQLSAGNYDLAGRHFQAAIKLRPDVLSYHLLLGTVYHLQYLSGRNTAELAMTAYEVAGRLDERSPLPHLQMGRLHFEAKRYKEARDAFLRAYAKQPTSPEALDGLISSAWYAGDLAMAWSAREEAKTRGLDTAAGLRLDVLLGGVLDDRVLGAANPKPRPVDYGYRLDALPAATSAAGAGSAPLDQLARRYGYAREQIAQLQERVAELKQADTDSDGTVSDDDDDASEDDESSESDGASRDGPPQVRRWFECDTQPGLPRGDDESDSYSESGTGDETEKLPAIPQPCPGAPAPAAVLLDTAIIQSSDVASNSYGINLLSALSVYATGARSVSNVFGGAAERGGTDGTTNVRSFSLNLGTSPTTNYITYALDIANVVRSTNEVISQPTLVALDRLPSTFFSGAVVTLGVTGNNQSSSSIEDKPIGISLSITPTVIDKDTLNLNVKVARSALSTTSLGSANTFNQALSTTRTTVSASVTARYGQTILVSGLTETGSVKSDNGTPILKDIPALQWLFDRQSEAQFRSSILVAITPRKVDSAAPGQLIEAIKDPQVRSRLRRLFDKLAEESTIRLTLKRLSSVRFFDLTKDGDFEADHWHERTRLQRLLDDAERMIRR